MHTRARAVTCRLRVPLHPRECAHDHPPLRHPLDGAAGGAPPPYRPQSDHGPSGMWGWRGHRPYSGTTAVSLPLATGLRHSTLHGSLRYTTQRKPNICTLRVPVFLDLIFVLVVWFCGSVTVCRRSGVPRWSTGRTCETQKALRDSHTQPVGSDAQIGRR